MEYHVDHKIDPDGDVVLILRDPNAPFAVLALEGGNEGKKYNEKCNNKKKKKKKKSASIITFHEPLLGDEPSQRLELVPEVESALEIPLATEDEPPLVHEVDPSPEMDVVPRGEPVLIAESTTLPEAELSFEDGVSVNHTIATPKEVFEICFQLSSRHLILSSVYFRKIFHGRWKESTISSDGFYTIDASEWDVEALLILMNIIHGRVRRVPRSISLEMLAKIAVIVDYYDCHEVVELFVHYWVENLRQSLPNKFDRDLYLWLTVSWVFSQEDLFEMATKVAIEESKEPIQTLKLPIPSNIVDTIASRRQRLIDTIVSKLHELLTQFYKRTECCFECSSTLSGALAKQMHANGLLTMKSTPSVSRYSVAEIITILREFKSPNWAAHGSFASWNIHNGSLAPYLDPIINRFVIAIDGLALKDFLPVV